MAAMGLVMVEEQELQRHDLSFVGEHLGLSLIASEQTDTMSLYQHFPWLKEYISVHILRFNTQFILH